MQKFVVHYGGEVLGHITVPMGVEAVSNAHSQACAALHLEDVGLVAWEIATNLLKKKAEQGGDVTRNQDAQPDN